MAVNKFSKIKFGKPNFSSEIRLFTDSSQKIREWSDIAVNDRYLLYSCVFWLSGVIVSLALLVFYLPKIPPEIPLFYGRSWGADQIAHKSYLLLLPAGTFLLGLVNLTLGIASYHKDKLISYMLGLGICIITLLSFLTVFNIIHLLT